MVYHDGCFTAILERQNPTRVIIIVIMFNVRIAVTMNIINKLCLRVITVLETPQPHNNNTEFSYISTFKTRAQGNIFNMPDGT